MAGRPNSVAVRFDFIERLFFDISCRTSLCRLVSKLKVYADTDDVLIEFYVTIRIDTRECRCCGGVPAATIAVIAHCILRQVDKKVFDLGGPILGERPFQSAADCPAEFRVGLHRQAVQRRLHIRAGATSGAVDEDAVPGVAEARTDRSQPIALGLAAQSGCGRIEDVRRKKAGAKCTATAAADTLPIKIAFDAEYPCAPLAANTDCSADQATVDVEVAG